MAKGNGDSGNRVEITAEVAPGQGRFGWTVKIDGVEVENILDVELTMVDRGPMGGRVPVVKLVFTPIRTDVVVEGGVLRVTKQTGPGGF